MDVGIINHSNNIKNIDQIEERTKIRLSDCTGIIISFKINFTPSIKGWVEPLIPTLFGPLHRCAADKIFLSKSVEYAIISKTGTIIRTPNSNFHIKAASKS